MYTPSKPPFQQTISGPSRGEKTSIESPPSLWFGHRRTLCVTSPAWSLHGGDQIATRSLVICNFSHFGEGAQTVSRNEGPWPGSNSLAKPFAVAAELWARPLDRDDDRAIYLCAHLEEAAEAKRDLGVERDSGECVKCSGGSGGCCAIV